VVALHKQIRSDFAQHLSSAKREEEETTFLCDSKFTDSAAKKYGEIRKQ
jgi:hypothetical protein